MLYYNIAHFLNYQWKLPYLKENADIVEKYINEL